MDANTVPADVVEWLRAVFAECNARITEKLSSNPNVSEESLDQTWVEHLSHFSSPIELASGWLVRIETHYLGGMRHFGNFEVADIGLLYFLRRGGEIVRSKVALLQSKRLYPAIGAVEEEGVIDYQIGFARLADPETLSRSLSVEAEYQFSEHCRFGAIRAGSKQVELIDEYAERSQLRIYYQLYGPWTLPHTRRVPSAAWNRPTGAPTLGVRVLPIEAMHQLLAGHEAGFRPRVSDLASVDDDFGGLGWPVERFVADELVGCREGSSFGSIGDANIQNMFYRRSGPIAAAVSITIEEPFAGG